jgi:DNA-binding transcriptional LysR family regulator
MRWSAGRRDQHFNRFASRRPHAGAGCVSGGNGPDPVRKRGCEMPRANLFGFSVDLVEHFVADGPFLTVYSRSIARFFSLRELPVTLPARPLLIAIATLKNRTMSPVVERFIGCAREVANEITKAKPRTAAVRGHHS